jgi:hypothetical protein
MLQDWWHLPMVTHREELPIVPQKCCCSERFGQVHL